MINMTMTGINDEVFQRMKGFNFSEAEFEEFMKNWPNYTIYAMPDRNGGRACDEDAEKYCDGTMKNIATAYKSIHGYVSLAVCLFGTIANLLNAAVLTRKEMASAPINRILTGLAVADMLVMLEYVPFSCYMYLVFPDTRNFPYSWAVFILFHVHFSQILHTISICLTLTLAVWRYIAIRRSLCELEWTVAKGENRNLKKWKGCRPNADKWTCPKCNRKISKRDDCIRIHKEKSCKKIRQKEREKRRNKRILKYSDEE